MRIFSIAEALALQDGRIVAVGDNQTISALRSDSTKVVDLAGHIVIPGLIDNHVHPIRAAQIWNLQVRIDGVSSRPEALDIIAAKASTLEPGAWLAVEGGWTGAQFADQPGDWTLAELDRVAPNNPFFAVGLGGLFLNSKALAAVGMSPTDGVRHQASEIVSEPFKPIIRQTSLRVIPPNRLPLIRVLANQLPHLTQQQWLQNVFDMALALSASGLTSVYFMGREVEPPLTDDSLAQLISNHHLAIRAWHALYPLAVDEESTAAAIESYRQNTPLSGDEWGGLLGLGEYVYLPFGDRPGMTTPFPEEIMSPMTRMLEAAARNGWPLYHQHLLSNVAITQLLAQLDKLNEQMPLAPLRWGLGHLPDISKDNIQHAKKLGLGAMVTGGAVRPRRIEFATPLQDIQDSGITWGFGSDGLFVAPFKPFGTLAWAVSGQNVAGQKVFSQTVSREDALIAHTRSNAWLLFQEDRIGSLEVGKLADLVVLDRDYMEIPATEIYDIKPIMTMLGGQVVFDAGVLSH